MGRILLASVAKPGSEESLQAAVDLGLALSPREAVEAPELAVNLDWVQVLTWQQPAPAQVRVWAADIEVVVLSRELAEPRGCRLGLVARQLELVAGLESAE